jgi:hypothetical protein
MQNVALRPVFLQVLILKLFRMNTSMASISVDSKGGYVAPRLCTSGAFVSGLTSRGSDAWVDSRMGRGRKSGSKLPHSKTDVYLSDILDENSTAVKEKHRVRGTSG